nr:lipid II flippase MurJ [Sphingobacterium athyrii]
MIAKYFGVSMEKDIWLLSFSLVLTLDAAIWGPLNDVFRAKFVTIKETDGYAKAISATQSLLFYMFLFSCLVVFILFLFTDSFVDIISTGYSVERRQQLVEMLRLVAPILLVNQASLIGISILNAFDSFIVPEIASFCSQIINILILVFFVDRLGIYVLWVASMVSLFILIFFIFYKIKKLKIPLFKKFRPKFTYFRIFFLFALPLFVPYLIGQINSIVEKKLISSVGTGAVSIIDFAKKFPDMINVIISSVVLTVLTPTITRLYVNNNKNEFDKSFLDSFGLGLLIIGFFCVFMFVGSGDLMMFFYGKSAVDHDSLLEIIKLNKYYSLAAFTVFLYVVFGTCMLAIGKNKMNALSGTMTQLTVIILNVTLVNKFGVEIFPFSILFSHLFAAIFMFTYYPYNKSLVIRLFIKFIIYLGIVTIGLALLSSLLFHQFSINSYIMRVVVISLIEVILFVVLGFVFNIKDIQLGVDFMLKKLGVR